MGAFFSLNTGLTNDEWHEQRNWEFNVALFKHLLFQVEMESVFVNYPDKYYGIGFHIISQPIQFFLSKIILSLQNIDNYGALLLSKHFVIFISFFTSGIFVYLIISKVIKNKFFNYSATFLYLLYPYLLGHGLYNPKDTPFLCFWIVCTYFSVNMFDKASKEKAIQYRDIALLSCLSAFLLSIRITGILIFIQYFITFIIFLNTEKFSFIYFFKLNFKRILLFISLTSLITYLLYPVFWKNPLLIFDAIDYMSKHFNNVCTLTLSKCMFSKNLDSAYIPIWLSVKLPLLILIGLILLPFTEKKIFVNKSSNITFGTILVSALFIPAIMIFKKVHLYDELRQVLFLVPLIFILGIISIYIFSKKIFYFLAFITLLIFFIENIKIYPYQYVWFNTPARVLDLSKNFELDYWGVSGKELALNVSKLNEKTSKKPCILAAPIFSVKAFLDSNLYSCFGFWGEIDTDFPRPFWAIQNVRNLKKGKSYKCSSVYESKFSLLFSDEDIITGRVVKCI